MNLWRYYSTNGLGFHEYLQLAEDLGAEALYECNPGFGDNYRRAEYAPPEQVPAFVTEAMDALEYALGPADSHWAAKRSKSDRPAPFKLEDVEIGREAGGKRYLENYKPFYDAIRCRYPNLTIISNQRTTEAAVEVVDDHHYGPPAAFFADSTKYDTADRRKPKVQVGEYGCNRDVGEGNLIAALAEAAYVRARTQQRCGAHVVLREGGELVMKLMNPAGRTLTASIAARGLEMASSAARVITLGHHDPAIENAIDEPGLIIPRLSESRVTGGSLILALKPHSLTVARIRVKENWQTAYTRLG